MGRQPGERDGGGVEEKMWGTVICPTAGLPVVQSLSRVRLYAASQMAAHQASLSFSISQSFLKLMSNELMMPSNYLLLCHPLLLSSVFPSIKVFLPEGS